MVQTKRAEEIVPLSPLSPLWISGGRSIVLVLNLLCQFPGLKCIGREFYVGPTQRPMGIFIFVHID